MKVYLLPWNSLEKYFCFSMTLGPKPMVLALKDISLLKRVYGPSLIQVPLMSSHAEHSIDLARLRQLGLCRQPHQHDNGGTNGERNSMQTIL